MKIIRGENFSEEEIRALIKILETPLLLCKENYKPQQESITTCKVRRRSCDVNDAIFDTGYRGPCLCTWTIRWRTGRWHWYRDRRRRQSSMHWRSRSMLLTAQRARAGWSTSTVDRKSGGRSITTPGSCRSRSDRMSSKYRNTSIVIRKESEIAAAV